MIIYEGPSEITGEPIVAIMTGVDRPSHNKKTGPVAQVIILAADVSPLEELKLPGTSAICGDCPLRNKSCYVTVHQSPTNIWKKFKAGGYAPVAPALAGYNRSIRLGSYGEPAAVPAKIWDKLLSKSRMHLGYTHQMETQPHMKGVVQASVESEADALKYQAAGWKTFRIRQGHEPLLPGEVICPNETNGVQCLTCGLCNGQTKNVAITIHGTANKIKKFINWSETHDY